MVVVFLMVLAVNVLLLSASVRFLGQRENPLRIIAASLLGTLFAMLSMVPGFSFLGHFLWRLCAMALTALLAFGFSRKTLPKLLLFLLLQLSLGGVAQSKSQLVSMLLGAAGIGLACLILGKGNDFIPVELTYGKQTVHITALRDTGNDLRDPITGKSVLVVGADVAQALTGLTPEVLQNPVEAMGIVPGLRLIPYRTVGNTGFLLGLRLADTKIGSKQGSAIVAFSPQILGSNYQALTGGML